MTYELLPFTLIAGWFFVGAFLLVFCRAKPEAALLWPGYAFVGVWLVLFYYAVLLLSLVRGEYDDEDQQN